MFYITIHSTHSIYAYMAQEIWLKTTEIARGIQLLPLQGVQQEFFYRPHYTDRIVHTTAFITSNVEHWLERGSKM